MFRLLDILFPPRTDEKIIRATTDDDFLALMRPQLVPLTRPATITLLPFHHPHVRSSIHEAKYHGTNQARRRLALVLAEYLRDADVRFTKPHIVPVPLGKRRKRERGFNQVEEITRYALRDLGEQFILDPKLLERVKETSSQVSLERHRREENMRGAFAVSQRLAKQDRITSHDTYIIIDDVITTGATLQAAIDALKAAGAEHVIPIALAH